MTGAALLLDVNQDIRCRVARLLYISSVVEDDDSFVKSWNLWVKYPILGFVEGETIPLKKLSSSRASDNHRPGDKTGLGNGSST